MFINSEGILSSLGPAAPVPPRRPELAGVPERLHPYLAGSDWQHGQLKLNWGGYRLASVFQPIVSFSHASIVAHEALLRVVGPGGRSMSPSALFSPLFGQDDLLHLDRATRLMHIINSRRLPGRFFLNLHPQLFDSLRHGDSLEAARAIGEFVEGSESRFVIEIVEEEITDHAHFEEGVAALRDVGLGIALDDFGAGHSNFDRVWKIRPEVVKLDRSFAARAAEDRSVRRLLPQIVSLLHEAGTLVLLEGIETLDQAWIAMDANIDFGQGWYFAHPISQPVSKDALLDARIGAIWQHQSTELLPQPEARLDPLSDYLRCIRDAAWRLGRGEALESAAACWQHLPYANSLYLLDQEGCQLGVSIEAGRVADSQMSFRLGHQPGARWSRREYFVKAIRAPGEAQATRPYLSVASGRLCATVSICIEQGAQRFVLCGDVDWAALDAGYEN
ncbi:EAL domain-containing protein [Uliginosibacterium sp. TH139]|uniref:EAL domain-containing protein n=1 Tax=Uliginosibacterium sp. TH139 TaxID=2067453 RepID=UPI000C7A11C3|nr:EAL domain-containing protein [Uliginosibacterium sp. TH139]PLK47428.1 EAL domain-containing protein [Uliginosibacterium sp. TH139]